MSADTDRTQNGDDGNEYQQRPQAELMPSASERGRIGLRFDHVHVTIFDTGNRKHLMRSRRAEPVAHYAVNPFDNMKKWS